MSDMDFTPEDIIGSASPVGTYMAALEQPGGILDQRAAEFAAALAGATDIPEERAELGALTEDYAAASIEAGEVASTVQHIEVTRQILGDPDWLTEDYIRLTLRMEQLSPEMDTSPDGEVFATWKRLWDRIREVTSNEYQQQLVIQRAIVYAEASEKWGRNAGSIQFIDWMRSH